MGFTPIGLCVLTVCASIRDPASIGDRHLFETRRLIEVLRYVLNSMANFSDEEQSQQN